MSILRRARRAVARRIDWIRFGRRHPQVPRTHQRTVPTAWSQAGQDLLLLSLLRDLVGHEDAWIVDIGANDPLRYSNSLLFERHFGHRVLAIDPLEEFARAWSRERPDARFLSCAIGSRPGTARLSVPSGADASADMFASLTGDAAHIGAEHFEHRDVPVRRLDEVLAQEGIERILFMSLDVEGVEMDVLASLDLDAVSVAAFVIENNHASFRGDDVLRAYLMERGYRFACRVADLDDIFVRADALDPDWSLV